MNAAALLWQKTGREEHNTTKANAKKDLGARSLPTRIRLTHILVTNCPERTRTGTRSPHAFPHRVPSLDRVPVRVFMLYHFRAAIH